MSKTFLILGTLNTFICILLGAFGAHGLKKMLSSGILVIGLLLQHLPNSRLIPIAGWLMLLGIILFSFSLYAISISGGIPGLGIVTPFGGVSFLSAWLLLTYAIWKGK